MAIQSYENNILKYQQIVQDNFKVQNPHLLKTGVLGTLVNILALQEYDTFDYYNKVFQENNPSLAKDFNSMLFHSNFYNVDITFAEPATLSVYLQIPKINTDNIRYYEYTIPKNSPFISKDGMDFIIESEVRIIQSQSKIKAYQYTSTEGKVDCNIITSTDFYGNEVYLVQINDVKQYRRRFYKYTVPFYQFGSTFNFDVSVKSYKEIYQINAWLNENPDSPIDELTLDKFSSIEISPSFGIKEMNIKYYQFGSSRYDYDLFLDIKDSTLSFKTGNGINGIYLQPGQEIIIETKNTLGEYGNVENIEFAIENVMVTTVDLDGKQSVYNTVLNGFSVNGASGGKSVEDIESIRSKIFNKIKIRNGIVTQADFESVFSNEGINPFIDVKFINNNTTVFVFNVLKDNGEVIPTTALNISEVNLSNDPFYPTMVVNDQEFISPFYYKKLNNNITQAFMVDTNIEVPLFTSATVDQTVRLNNEIKLFITYDFIDRKSYIKIEGAHDDYTYKLSCNLFDVELNFGNNFTYEVNTRYTDSFCIINNYLYDFTIDVYDPNGIKVITFFNYESEDRRYYQLIPQQEIYKFYIEIEAQDIEPQETSAALDYLDNEFASIMNTIESLYEPIKDGELSYALRLPFISKDYFDKTDYQKLYSILDSFFKINKNKENFPLTTRVQQTFFNTVDIDPKYQPFLFEQSSILINNPKIPIMMDVVIDKQQLILSRYDSEYDLEFDIQLKTIEFLKKKEGFEIEFYESELEDYLYNYYNEDKNFPLLKNINIKSPSMFVINNPDDIYYNMSKELTIKEILDFIPPYFYYDYENIIINPILN